MSISDLGIRIWEFEIPDPNTEIGWLVYGIQMKIGRSAFASFNTAVVGVWSRFFITALIITSLQNYMHEIRKERRLVFASPPSTPDSLPRPARIREHRGDEVGDEPDIFVTHVLIDVDQDQHAWKQESQEYVSPDRDRVRRIEIWIEKEEYDENQPREKEREKKKVKIDLHDSGL